MRIWEPTTAWRYCGSGMRPTSRSAPLKRLQGLIWAEGYAAGDFKGHVFPDAVRGARAMARMGELHCYVFSSGSIDAQKLLFRHTAYGDLTPLFSGHFDTAIGSKLDPSSYRAISNQLGLTPREILFPVPMLRRSSPPRWKAGFEVTLLARDGVPPLTAFSRRAHVRHNPAQPRHLTWSACRESRKLSGAEQSRHHAARFSGACMWAWDKGLVDETARHLARLF